MTDPNFIILYVNNPIASSVFYQDILGKEPVETSPTFAMFALASGVMLGLWARHTVAPSALEVNSGTELAFAVANNAVVDAMHVDWSEKRLNIIQEPTKMEFGYTFVGLDPDGHRLRVFAAVTA